MPIRHTTSPRTDYSKAHGKRPNVTLGDSVMSLSRDFRPFTQPMFLVAVAAILAGVGTMGAIIYLGTS